ncbi:MAG: AMP-binding protein [Lentisphaeria bacterium]
MLERYLPCRDFSSYEAFHRDFRIQVPPSFNFATDVVDELAAVQPDGKALVWSDDHGGDAVFTFADMARESARTANFLQACGVRKGDAVMLVLKRRYEFWFCLLALHRLGAVAIPATHLLTTKDFLYRFQAAKVTALISVGEPAVLDRADEAEQALGRPLLKITVTGGRPGWRDFADGLRGRPERFAVPAGADAIRNDDPMLLYFTSGTTGMPKMVSHTYSYPLGHLATAVYWQGVQPGGVHLTVADTGWAKAAWGKIYGQWIAGSAVMAYDYDKFVPGRLLAAMARHGVTTFCAPPTVYRFLIKEPPEALRLPALRRAVVAGEPLNPEVFNRFRELTGLSLLEGYGQTEMTLAIATYPWVTPRPGSMGMPSPGYDVDIVDEDGQSLESGCEGQIIIRTATSTPVGMFAGYYGDPELTRSVWRDGIYYTGDVAWRDEDGYYWFVGRADDVIKSSGYRIGPFEVESALLEHPAVLECAITGVPDDDRGQIVKATVVLTAGHAPSPRLVAELQEHVKKTTAPYKYPRLIEFVPALPKTISGKIRRVAIRGEAASNGDQDE